MNTNIEKITVSSKDKSLAIETAIDKKRHQSKEGDAFK